MEKLRVVVNITDKVISFNFLYIAIVWDAEVRIKKKLREKVKNLLFKNWENS